MCFRRQPILLFGRCSENRTTRYGLELFKIPIYKKQTSVEIRSSIDDKYLIHLMRNSQGKRWLVGIRTTSIKEEFDKVDKDSIKGIIRDMNIDNILGYLIYNIR